MLIYRNAEGVHTGIRERLETPVLWHKHRIHT